MPKLLTPNVLSILNQKTGISPVVVISVLWGHDLHWYSSRKTNIPNLKLEPRILSVGDFNCQRKLDNTGSSGTLDFILSDHDGSLKFLVDITPVEKAPCSAFIWLEGTSSTDMILMITGRLSSPEWNEDAKTLSLTVETEIEQHEAGYSPTLEDFPDLAKEAVGNPWPMVFGTVAHVPAVRAKVKRKAFLLADISLYSRGYIRGHDGKVAPDDQVHVKTYAPDSGDYATDVIYLDDAAQFPQGTEIKITIDKVIFKGQLDSQGIFKVTQANVPKYQNLKLMEVSDSDRDSILPLFKTESTSSGDSSQSKSEDWWNMHRNYGLVKLVDTKASIAGMHCYFQMGDQLVYNFCIRQIMNICLFKDLIIDPHTKTYSKQPKSISKVFACCINGVDSDILESESGKGMTLNSSLIALQSAAQSHFWKRPAQTPVYVYDLEDPDIYIASIIEMSAITGVYSKRNIKIPNEPQRKILSPVPKPYFDIKLKSDYKINNQFVSGVIFNTPLSEQGTDWEDDIYVSGTSKLGPNPVDIIRYLIEQYSTLTLDGPSFDLARTKVTPCNFAYFDRRNALELAQDIAWQARCILTTDSGIVRIKFLAETPSPLFLFNDSNIEANTLKISYTNVHDIITKFVGTYAENYKDVVQPSHSSKSETRQLVRHIRAVLQDTYKEATATRTYTYRENIERYGTLSEERNVFIYDNVTDVQQCIDFWGHRMANSWQLVEFNSFMNCMFLQPWDAAAIATTQAPVLNTVAEVQAVRYNHDSKTVSVLLWLPIIAGTGVIDSRAWTP